MGLEIAYYLLLLVAFLAIGAVVAYVGRLLVMKYQSRMAAVKVEDARDRALISKLSQSNPAAAQVVAIRPLLRKMNSRLGWIIVLLALLILTSDRIAT